MIMIRVCDLHLNIVFMQQLITKIRIFAVVTNLVHRACLINEISDKVLAHE